MSRKTIESACAIAGQSIERLEYNRDPDRGGWELSTKDWPTLYSDSADEMVLRIITKLRSELSTSEAQNAEMREALLDEKDSIMRSGRHHVEERRMAIIESAISSDSGRDYVHKSEAEKAEMVANAVNMEMADLKRILNDPQAVHANILRGTIARPSDYLLTHLLGEEAQYKVNEFDNQKKQLQEARELVRKALTALPLTTVDVMADNSTPKERLREELSLWLSNNKETPMKSDGNASIESGADSHP